MMIAMGTGQGAAQPREWGSHARGYQEEIVELLIPTRWPTSGAPRTAAAWENVQKVFSR